MLRLVARVKKMGYVLEKGKAVSGQIVQLKQRINRIIKYLKYLISVITFCFFFISIAKFKRQKAPKKSIIIFFAI